MFLEARGQDTLQDCYSKHSRIHAHDLFSVHQLPVQMKFYAQTKNS